MSRMIWIACFVKPGAFTDERLILVDSSEGEWIGFVHRDRVLEGAAEGESYVRATIIRIHGERFTARVLGEALGRSTIEGSIGSLRNERGCYK